MRGTSGAIEHIACILHFVTIQESSEFLDADVIKEKFHEAHSRECATLCNKNTFEPDFETKSVFVPGKRREGCDKV